jgi:internalin A
MGEREHPIGKLRIKVNLRQLLDGYEPIEVRQKRRKDDRDLAKMGSLGMEDWTTVSISTYLTPINKEITNPV